VLGELSLVRPESVEAPLSMTPESSSVMGPPSPDVGDDEDEHATIANAVKAKHKPRKEE
jgi:hypothetical protein